jgi:adenosylhomocysteine nucleosidase
LKVLVTFAVEPEFASWRKSRTFVATMVNGTTVYSSEMGGAKVDVVLTGMGPANARRATQAALSRSHAMCISAGFAGALKREHGVADILVATRVRQIDGSGTVECNPALVEGCLRVGGVKNVDTFLTSEKIVESAKEKAALAECGDAVEMESFAVLSVAEDCDVPAIAIRVISDRLDQNMPMDFSGSIDQCGHVMKGKLAREIASDPFKIPALIRLGRQSKTASERLAKFLESYIEHLSVAGVPENTARLEKVARG